MFESKTEKINKLVEKKKAEKIIPFLNDRDGAVALAAIAGLGKAGGDDAYNALIPLLRSNNAAARAAAAQALGELGASQGRTHLSYHLAQEKDEKVREAIRGALDRLPESK
jgi:HEAT repeat protein